MDKVRLGLCLAFVMALATAPDSAMAASLPGWNGANALEHGGRGGRGVRPGVGVGVGVVAGCNIYGQNKLSSVSIGLTEPPQNNWIAVIFTEMMLQEAFFTEANMPFILSGNPTAYAAP